MHITVSFKDHSSICTCMLLKKKKKILNDLTETRTSPQTNKQPANERGGSDGCDRGDRSDTRVFFFFSLLTWNRAVRNWCVEQLSSTPNMAVHRRLSQVNVMLSVNVGLHFFPTKPNSDTWSEIQRAPGPDYRSVQRLCCCSPWHVFLFCSSYQTCQPWTF